MTDKAHRGIRRDTGESIETPDAIPARANLRDSPKFSGAPDSNEHYALLYETEDEWIANVASFVRRGLEQGEHCLYLVDDRSEEEVVEALHGVGVDADGALASGALAFRAVDDAYLRNGRFDPDGMRELHAATSAAAEEYDGFRVSAETGWLLDEEIGEDLETYERTVNELFDGGSGTALCQYARAETPAKLLCDVVEAHPKLIYDDTVCHNFYYAPPEERPDSESADVEIEYMMATLLDHTKEKRRLEERQEYLRRQNEITADPSRSFEEKLQALFELGCEQFDLELGAMARVDADEDWFEVEYVSDDHEHFEPGVELPLSETYCTAATELRAAGSVSDPEAEGYDDITVYREFGIRAYLGTYVEVDGGADRTFFFVTSQPRDGEFSDEELTFHQMMGQWVKYELERKRREEYQRRLYEITADSERSFDEKLQNLFELGCERFGLELGALARVDPSSDLFEVMAVSGGHEHLAPGTRASFSETYCRTLVDRETSGITEPEAEGFGDTVAYEEFGVNAYLGTRIPLDGSRDRSLFFVSTDPRERDFSPAEKTFHRMMGQWVKHELEVRQRERALERSNERLEQFAYAASHDLQEPLRMVTSYLQLIEKRYGDAFDEEGEEFLEFAVDGADRMRAMIDGLLEYSRVETRGDPFAPTELDEVLEDVLTDLRVKIEESSATIEMEPLPRIRGDASQLRQLFQNLLSNAIEYSGEEPPAVRVTVERGGSDWILSVHDDGIGIPEDEEDRIFEVFQRLHTRDEHPGTGLGLALCKRIVERHGGQMWVDSEPGEGSTFSLSLPAADD